MRNSLLALGLIAFLSGCGTSSNSMNEGTLKTIYSNKDFNIVKDVNTGCEYIANDEGGITPRLEIDGKPRCVRD